MKEMYEERTHVLKKQREAKEINTQLKKELTK